MYACSGMMDNAASWRGSYTPLVNLSPDMAGLKDCESLFTDPETKRMVAEKYSFRHFLPVHQALGRGGLDNVHWPRGPENPADAPTKVKSDLAPLSRLLQTGSFPQEAYGRSVV